MIHRVLVGPETELAPLKKLFRQKLMTGGAVVRLREGLSSDDLEAMFEIFSDGALRNGVQAAVLEEIKKHPAASESVIEAIRELRLG